MDGSFGDFRPDLPMSTAADPTARIGTLRTVLLITALLATWLGGVVLLDHAGIRHNHGANADESSMSELYGP